MNLSIRPVSHDDIEAVVQLSLFAWIPVFRSFKHVLGSSIYPLLYPDWEKQQREEVESVCKDDAKTFVWIAALDGVITGFIAYTLDREEKTGEVVLLAVHPNYQNQGIGTALNTFALGKMKAGGMKLAIVATGGDPGHAPARRSYEKAGYTALPLVRYYKDLNASKEGGEKPSMLSAHDAVTLCRLLEQHSIRFWVMGGWGVDALLHRETRPHKDLDILVTLGDLPMLWRLFDEHGFTLQYEWEENRWVDGETTRWPTAFVVMDAQGRELDVHVIDFGPDGAIVQHYSNPWPFPSAITGQGSIAGDAVICVSRETQLAMHTGYTLPDGQLQDLKLLQED